MKRVDIPNSRTTPQRIGVAGTFALVLAVAAVRLSSEQLPPPLPVLGPNVNMSAGPTFLKLGATAQDLVIQGDPLQNANGFELSCAMSARNPLHFLCFANDNRAVDVLGVGVTANGDSNIGMFQSIDGGGSWASTLHQDFFPKPLGYDYAVDPQVSAGVAGMFNHVGLVKNRGDKSPTAVYQSSWIDLNDQDGDRYPAKHLFTSIVDVGTPQKALDRPTVLVTEPQGATATFQVDRGGGTTVQQTVPVGVVHIAWVAFLGEGNNEHSQIWKTTSFDGGRTFGAKIKLSEEIGLSQGVQLAKKKGSNLMCAAWRKGTDPQSPEGIAVACSQDGGTTFAKAESAVPGGICPVDWSTTSTRFRTLTTPTIAADAERFYMAWAERPRNGSGACNTNSGDGAPEVVGSRVMVSTSTDGVNWTTPTRVDPYTGPGFQIFPQMTFSGPFLNVVWFDSRNDEAKLLQSTIDEAPIVAAPAGKKRHTIDVYGARATPGAPPVWGAPFPVSKYIFGVHPSDPPGTLRQLQFNVANVRLFAKMTQPGLGDFIAATSEQWVLADPIGQPGVWAPNLGQLGDSTVWTASADNRNVRLRSNEIYADALGNIVPRSWTPPTLPGLLDGGTSIYTLSMQRPACNANFTGMRDQNPYGSLWTQGSLIGALGNNRPMLPMNGTTPVPRSMAPFAQNFGAAPKLYRFEIFNQPPGGTATFKQFPAQSEPPQTAVEAVGVTRTTVVRTAYVTSTAPRPPIGVDVFEIPMPAKPVANLSSNGTTVTATVTAHGYVSGDPVIVSGATPREYNGTYTLTKVDNNKFTYQLASPATQSQASGAKAAAPDRNPALRRFARRVWFNADPSAPNLLETPAPLPPNDPNFDPNLNEVHSVEIGRSFTHDVSSPDVSNPGWEEAGWQEAGWQEAGWQEAGWQEAGWQEAGWQEAGWQEAGWQEAGWQEAGWQESGWETDLISSGDLQNSVVRDYRFPIRSKGNTWQMVKVANLLNGKVPEGVRFQFLVFRLGLAVATGPNSCNPAGVTLVGHKHVIANIDNTNLSLGNFTNPAVDPSSITIPIGPDEIVFGNLRVFDTNGGARLPSTDAALLGGAPGAVGTQDAAQGITTPQQSVSSLAILKLFPPSDGNAGRAYSAQLQAIGGTPPYTWTIVSGLPAGLKLNSATGLISQDTSVRPVAGTFTFTVQVTDSRVMNQLLNPATALASFTITMSDIDPPSLTVPSNIVAEATSAAGAAVFYSVTATDAVDPNPFVTCAPPSGSTFPLTTRPATTTSVNCSATDASGNHSEDSFNVTVRDTTRPTLTLPADITVEATGHTGAAVSYVATANDLVDGAITPNCSPASGSTFPITTRPATTTLVSCSATDLSGNSASGSFNVTVRDTTPPYQVTPTFSSPPPGQNGYFGSSQVPVSGSASAVDLASPIASISCTDSASGLTSGSLTVTGPTSASRTLSVNGNGTHNISCSGTDTASNTSSPPVTATVKIDLLPPSITAVVTPTSIWSPNGKKVPVTVSGTVTDAASGVDLSSGTFLVNDEYVLTGPILSGPVVLTPVNGSYTYTFVVQLTASRLGSDKDGRLYQIFVKAKDKVGNLGTSAPARVVAHDQSK